MLSERQVEVVVRKANEEVDLPFVSCVIFCFLLLVFFLWVMGVLHGLCNLSTRVILTDARNRPGRHLLTCPIFLLPPLPPVRLLSFSPPPPPFSLFSFCFFFS